MNEHELKHHLLRWVEDYCNREFDQEDLPGGVALFLEQGADFLKKQNGVTSLKLGDYSVVHTTDYPDSLKRLLSSYRKVRFP